MQVDSELDQHHEPQKIPYNIDELSSNYLADLQHDTFLERLKRILESKLNWNSPVVSFKYRNSMALFQIFRKPNTHKALIPATLRLMKHTFPCPSQDVLH
jgi:hypothetical protein